MQWLAFAASVVVLWPLAPAAGSDRQTAPALRAEARAPAAPPSDTAASLPGAPLYREHCASCHGASAQGNGKQAARLEVAPPDLTEIARRNRGRFPMDTVVRIIEGRRIMKGHGGAGMPIWGDALLQPHEGYDEARVKERIRQIAKYLESIQVK